MSLVQKVSPSIDFTEKVGNHSSPLYVKLQPINNVTTFNQNLTSTYGPIEFLIPSKVLSLKNSRLSWDITIPIVTTSGATAAYSYIQANALCQLDRITFATQNTNQILADIPNLSRYASMLSPVLTRKEELDNKASPLNTTSVTAIPTMFASQTAYNGGSVNSPCEDVSRSNACVNPDGNNVDYGSPYYGIRKLFVSTATNATQYCGFEFNLGALKATICDLDQLLYFSGEQVLMSLYFAPIQKFAFLGTSATNPTTNQQNISTATAWSLQNLAMYLYTEQNVSVSQGIVQKVMSGGGIRIPFPYPFVQRQSVSYGSFSITQQLSRGFGSKLLFVGTSFFNTTETGGTAQDHSIQNLINTSATSYYTQLAYNTQLDNIPILTNNNINVIGSGSSNGEQWLYNKYHLAGSTISSMINYNVDFCHLDNFTMDPLCKVDWSTVDGLDLDSMHQYSVVGYGSAVSSTNVNIYLVFVCQKTLNLTSQGVQIS